jgi:hypothetical protein
LENRLHAAQAFLIVTPEYNHSFPAALKFLIDGFNEPWNAKPVAFVSYGGVSRGLRAVEHLRAVFAELHAPTVRETVSFANAKNLFDQSGALREPERHRQSMRSMLDRLLWWAVALRSARASIPFGRLPVAAKPKEAGKVAVINRFTLRPGKLDEFLKLQADFSRHLMQSGGAPGFRGGSMYRSLDGERARAGFLL